MQNHVSFPATDDVNQQPDLRSHDQNEITVMDERMAQESAAADG